ncbi:amidohydrolase family protein [Nocardioides zeae]|uniref:Amidohydrolase family protein n=1 Tax=Nocardioides imazamoxiresistens TaxID=3231893 RepID=A0ABU3PQR0_9ACTN|nr:amidohydrolase family protein [Nocardioides zeae]MDT9591563.1 amidohydrolase family protein [Nocardioides zeae]
MSPAPSVHDPDERVDHLHAVAARLGVPGIFDVHTHFLPPRVTEKVRAVFASAGPLIGREWPIRYDDADEPNVARLRAYGVRRFTALPYPHKPGMATFLNTWADDFAARTPEALRCATFFPEPEAGAYVAERVAAGVQVFKVHVQVGAFDVRDPLLGPVWSVLEEAGTPVVLHAGSGPVPTEFTGPGPVAELLARHPRLTLVMAHLGAPEYAEFLAMAETYERVHLDTTMAFTDFFDATTDRIGEVAGVCEHRGSMPGALLPRFAAVGEKVLFGSDFPHIPYPYVHQLEVLEALREREAAFDDAWLAGVVWHNAARLFGLHAAE